MGSFTSTPKIENADCADEDITESFQPTIEETLLKRCEGEVLAKGRPPLLSRNLRQLRQDSHDKPTVRVLQWNILSQSEHFIGEVKLN